MDINSIGKLCINLDTRSDRFRSFEANNIMGSVTFIAGVVNKDPFKGIARAHLNCIEWAKKHNWDKVLIMEDDVEYPAGLKTHAHIAECMATLPPDWDIVLGGASYLKGYDKVNQYWKRAGEFCGLHWYIVNQRVYDRILAYNYTDHIDRWISKQGFKCYLPNKIWAIQSDGYSDNVGKVTDYKSSYFTKFDVLR